MSGFEPGPGWHEVDPEDAGHIDLAAMDPETGRVARAWIRDEPMPSLPTEPGTVIRTGPFWWLKCETYTHPDGTPGNANAWLLLPHRSQVVLRAMSASHLGPQVIYDRACVLEQVDEYGFEVLAEPRAVTAKAVLAEVADWFEREAGEEPATDWRRRTADTIRREFGAES